MVYTNQIESSETIEQTDGIIAAILHENIMDQHQLPDDDMRQGYELLSQEPETHFNDDDDIDKSTSESDENSCSFSRETSNPNDNSSGNPLDDSSQIIPASAEILRHVWHETQPIDIDMDSKKVEEVKQVMGNITLPPSAIPEWAENIPEDEWKEYLFTKLNIRQKKF